MIVTVSDREFAFLKDIIRKKTEISLGDNKKYLVETRLSPLVLESGCQSFEEFCRKLSYAPEFSHYMEKVIEAITTNETYWFRDEYPFHYIQNVFLPQMADEIKIGKRKEMRIWSAASSSGQEAYSVAMSVLEFKKTKIFGKPLNECLTIVGTDISKQAVRKAKQAVYTNNEMLRGMPEALIDIYFRRGKDGWVLDEKVKSVVNFSVFNLQTPFPVSWGKFDIILLRNVIIYFSDEFKKVLFDKVARKLVPGGVLFLGTGETVSGYSDAFDICDYQKAKFYRLKD